MAQFASDNFAGTSGAVLSTYNAAWTRHPGTTGTTLNISDAGRLRSNTAGQSANYYHSGAPASADYSVSADIFAKETNGGFAYSGVVGRCDTSVMTFYHARYSGDTIDGWQLAKFVSGSVTMLGASAQSFTDETSKSVELRMVGTTIELYKEGESAPLISVTDSSITDAGKSGVRISFSNSDTIGLHLDNFSADDIATNDILVTDGMALVEAISKNREMILPDNHEFVDAAFIGRDMNIFDNSEISDQRFIGREMLLSDAHMIGDTQALAIDRVLVDTLLLPTLLSKVMDMLHNDPLLLADALTLEQTGAGAIVLRAAVDGMLLGDVTLRDLAAMYGDSLLIVDSASTEITAAQAIVLRAATDGVMLDALISKAIEKSFADGTFLSDSSLIDKITSGLDVLLTDSLLLSDLAELASDRAIDRTDSIFMSDSKFTELLMSLLDTMQVNDALFREVDLISLSGVIIDEMLYRMLDLSTRSDLLLADSTQATWTGVTVDFLVYARLGHNDPIGISTSFDDLLGRKASHNVWRVEA